MTKSKDAEFKENLAQLGKRTAKARKKATINRPVETVVKKEVVVEEIPTIHTSLATPLRFRDWLEEKIRVNKEEQEAAQLERPKRTVPDVTVGNCYYANNCPVANFLKELGFVNPVVNAKTILITENGVRTEFECPTWIQRMYFETPKNRKHYFDGRPEVTAKKLLRRLSAVVSIGREVE